MKISFAFASIVVATSISVIQAADLINGNYYGSAVSGITYSNWGLPGAYNQITDMSDGQCKSEPFSYQGGLSPLDREISWHFRGPMHLKQFAFYSLGSDSSPRDLKQTPHQRRYGHSRFHQHRGHDAEANEKRSVGDIITATINGQVVSWINSYAGKPTGAIQDAVQNVGAGKASTTAPPAIDEPTPTLNAGTGNWGRQAYYHAEKGEADGLVFLSNHGGDGSGVFDYTWGMSLSYASNDGIRGSASPQVLEDCLLQDNNEFAIFTDKSCQDGSCGTVRPGTVAYHGFDGASKLFLFEFDMPLSGKTGFNADMPAIWALNAEIPRTMQYGPAECSCWTSGCGEWDIFEVLDSGNQRCKSTFHGLRSGGESDYFQRPVDKTIKAAVIFDGENNAGHIVVLPDDTTFDSTLPASTVAGYVSSAGSQSSKLPIKEFRLPN